MLSVFYQSARHSINHNRIEKMARVVYTIRRRADMRTIRTLVDQPIEAAEDSDTYRLGMISDLIDETMADSAISLTAEEIYVSSEFIGDSDTSNKIWR